MVSRPSTTFITCNLTFVYLPPPHGRCQAFAEWRTVPKARAQAGWGLATLRQLTPKPRKGTTACGNAVRMSSHRRRLLPAAETARHRPCLQHTGGTGRLLDGRPPEGHREPIESFGIFLDMITLGHMGIAPGTLFPDIMLGGETGIAKQTRSATSSASPPKPGPRQ